MMQDTATPIRVQQECTLLKIFPRLPTLSSLGTNWTGIHLAHHEQPQHQLPEMAKAQHLIVVKPETTEPVRWEAKIEGQFQSGLFAGDAIALIPANTLHQFAWLKEDQFIALRLDPESLTQVEPDCEHLDLMPQFLADDPFVRQLGLALDAALTDGLDNHVYVEALTIALSAHLLKHYSKAKPPEFPYIEGLSKYRLQQVMDYVHAHIHETIQIAELAALAQMSPSHFTHLFKQSTGMSPCHFLIQCKLEKAKQLLGNLDLPISEIAYQLGFSSQSHFTRLFRKHLSTTPKAYRDRL